MGEEDCVMSPKSICVFEAGAIAMWSIMVFSYNMTEKCTEIFNNYCTSPRGRLFVLVACLPNLPSFYSLQFLVNVMPKWIRV